MGLCLFFSLNRLVRPRMGKVSLDVFVYVTLQP
nr:MAG TPA: hypothetical protein [Caudoviricetes sp.]